VRLVLENRVFTLFTALYMAPMPGIFQAIKYFLSELMNSYLSTRPSRMTDRQNLTSSADFHRLFMYQTSFFELIPKLFSN
jgi:hypothetical protein